MLLTPAALLGGALLTPRDASAGVVDFEIEIGIGIVGGITAMAERERALEQCRDDIDAD